MDNTVKEANLVITQLRTYVGKDYDLTYTIMADEIIIDVRSNEGKYRKTLSNKGMDTVEDFVRYIVEDVKFHEPKPCVAIISIESVVSVIYDSNLCETVVNENSMTITRMDGLPLLIKGGSRH